MRKALIYPSTKCFRVSQPHFSLLPLSLETERVHLIEEVGFRSKLQEGSLGQRIFFVVNRHQMHKYNITSISGTEMPTNTPKL